MVEAMQAYGVDNYMWPGLTCGANNPENCSYSAKDCTDFAMQRIRYTLGLPCLYLGNASSWASKAAGLGYTVNAIPHLGAILALGPNVNGASSDGHVGFVLGVGPGSFFGQVAGAGQVVVEQYNWVPCAWNIRVFPMAGSQFIHFADLSPASTGPPPAQRNPVMAFVASPLGVACIAGGIGLIAWSQLRRHAPGGFDPDGPRATVVQRAVVPGTGFGRSRQRLCPVCLGAGVVGTGHPVGYGYKKLPVARGPERMCPVCRGSGVKPARVDDVEHV